MATPILRSVCQLLRTQRASLALQRLAKRSIWIATVLLPFGDPALALEQTTAPVTCDTPAHHQMDFWVGDWQVFDPATNQLVAFDRVEKQYQGCILQETLTFLTDMYRRPGAKVRLAGIAVNRFDGESWLQMWADNQWGAILLRGTATASGSMEFLSVIPSRNRDVKLVYEKHSDGTLRILQYVAPAGSGKWTKYGDLEYRRNR
jgi:hypothetical protein